MLKGLMAINYTDQEHDTPNIVERDRDYDAIYRAGKVAAEAVHHKDVDKLAEAIKMSYRLQLGEGMESLVESEECLACKYCGGGWGGYAVYVFSNSGQRDDFVARHPKAKAIEPYMKPL
jgi:mevalonate kinase